MIILRFSKRNPDLIQVYLLIRLDYWACEEQLQFVVLFHVGKFNIWIYYSYISFDK